MTNRYSDELDCDFCEFYGIIDRWSLPVRKAAVLADGLSSDSRTKRKIAKIETSVETIILAGILDRLSVLVWQNTSDGQKGKNKPESVLAELVGGKNKKSDDILSFSTAAEFEAAKRKIIEGG